MTWPAEIKNPHDEFEQGWPTVDGWHTDAATGSDRALLHDVHHAAIDALLAYLERLEAALREELPADHYGHERDYDGGYRYICLTCSTDEEHVEWFVYEDFPKLRAIIRSRRSN